MTVMVACDGGGIDFDGLLFRRPTAQLTHPKDDDHENGQGPDGNAQNDESDALFGVGLTTENDVAMSIEWSRPETRSSGIAEMAVLCRAIV